MHYNLPICREKLYFSYFYHASVGAYIGKPAVAYIRWMVLISSSVKISSLSEHTESLKCYKSNIQKEACFMSCALCIFTSDLCVHICFFAPIWGKIWILLISQLVTFSYSLLSFRCL